VIEKKIRLIFGTTHQEEQWDFECDSDNIKQLIFIENDVDTFNIIFTNKATKKKWSK